MKIGVGLPNPVPGVDGRVLVEWARRAESAGFSTLATIDRLAYPSYESMTVVAAAAGATERIGLLTNILLAATRNPVVLAKEAASVYHLSGGRFTLGVGVGGRPDDFDVSNVPFEERGRRMDRMLDLLRRAWRGEAIEGCESAVNPGPRLDRGVPLLMGGTTDRAFERAARYAIGWTAGGGSPEQVRPAIEGVRRAWDEAGRKDDPYLVALSYYSVGNEEASARYVTDYYRFLGPEVAGMIAGATPRSAEAIRDAVAAFEEAGFDELILDPTVAELDQVDRLASVVL